MPIRSWRATPGDLSRSPLVVAQARAPRAWIGWSALVLVALVAGAAASHLYWVRQAGGSLLQAAALADLQEIRQGLEQSRLQLRVAAARGQELERQVDALNQQLRECQQEVTFFRKARSDKP